MKPPKVFLSRQKLTNKERIKIDRKNAPIIDAFETIIQPRFGVVVLNVVVVFVIVDQQLLRKEPSLYQH